MATGLVYILTNPCLDGWVKIGMTERNDIENRLRELNAPPNIPLSYRCYAVYEVDNPQLVEKHIHSLIDRVDASLHARERLGNGRLRQREFFRISPETAYGIFYDVATLRNDRDRLRLYQPTEEQGQEEELADSRSRRSNNSFDLLHIPVGEEIMFMYDDSISAKVIDNKNHVEYQGEEFSVTALAQKLLVEKRGWTADIHVNGWRFFVKDGITLSDLRDQLESQEAD